MKKSLLYISAALLLGATATSCRDEHLITEGEGRMMLETSIMSDVKVVSRALTAEQNEELCNKALIWISDPKKGLIYRYDGLAAFPQQGLPLPTGNYAVEAWTGDSVPASWEYKRYRGYQEFEITRGVNTNVELTCPIRNTVVSVKYGDKVAEVLSDLKLTVSLNDGITDGSHGLTYEGLTPAKGYYMLNSRTKGFVWTLEGTEASGKPFSKSGEYKDADVADAPYLAQTTEYVFNIKYDVKGEVEIGGAYFSIEVEPEPVKGEDREVLVVLAPEIKGSGFDLSQTIMGEPGNADPQSIVINGAAPLDRVEIAGSLLTAAGLAPDYDLIGMESQHETELEAKGFMIQRFYQNENKSELTNMRLVMSAEFFNAIPQGDYEMSIKATDIEGQTSSAVFSISLSNAAAILNAATDVTFTSAKISATLADGTATFGRLGFEYHKAGEAWTFVEGVREGTLLTAELTGLADGTTYEYRVVADDFTSKELTFSTEAYPQLPNAGFEYWSTAGDKNHAVPFGAGQSKFWDSGNQGSMTMSINVTTADATIKHSGNYSAKLESAYPSLIGIGKCAAGNIFVGEYLKTAGTDGELGWGRPWTAKPKALKGYVKYKPVLINKVGKNAPAEYVKGEMDRGIIYIALLNGELKEYNGTKVWPVIIKTKTQELFDKNASNVIAYGEKVFTETEGEGMIEFEIPLTDMNPGTVSYLMITASASKGGDYFSGGVGSTMWLDDLELVY